MKKSIDIETVLRELYCVSGCRVSIHGTDYTEIAAYPREASPFCCLIHSSSKAYLGCLRGDAEALSRVRTTEEPYIYRCPFGLYEAVAPLYHGGVLTGFLMMGQVADDAPASRDNVLERAMEYADDGRFTREEVRGAILRLPETDRERLMSFVSIMTICAEYITLSGRMDLPTRDLAHMVKDYINHHYAEHIALDDLCTQFGCSKSTLMNAFRDSYGLTVGKYLTDVRINRAIHCLNDTDAPVREISAECGYADQGYFTKVFAAQTGFSPTEFRRRMRENNGKI